MTQVSDPAQAVSTAEQQLAEGATAPSAPPPKPPRPNPKTIAAQVAAEIPSFGPAQEPLEHVITLHTLYVGAPDSPALQRGKTRDVALTQISLRKWDRGTVINDAQAVAIALNEGWTALNRQVRVATDLVVDEVVQEEDLGRRLEEEVEEQRKLDTFARGCIDRSTQVRALLGISITAPAAASQPSAETKDVDEEDGGVFRKLSGMAGRVILGSLTHSVEQDPQLPIAESATVPSREQAAGWLTEPILTEEHALIQQFSLVFDQVTAEGDASAIAETLELLGVSKETLAVLLSQVEQLARDQMELSAKIVANATADNQLFMKEANMLQFVRVIWNGVVEFFDIAGELT